MDKHMKAQKMRVYNIGNNRYVEVSSEYDMKYGRRVWYVSEWGVEHPKTLAKVPTLVEAKQIVNQLAADGRDEAR